MTQTVADHPTARSTRPMRPGGPPAPVPAGARPSAARAAAAARLVGGALPSAAPDRLDPSRRDRVRHLWVVPEGARTPAQRRRRARALLVAAAGLMVAVAFGLVYLHVVLAQRQYTLDHLTTKVQADRATYQRLRLQVAQLGSPPHIIATAEGQLGMRQPASVTYLTPTARIGSPAPSAHPAAGSKSSAPAGDADWPQIKSQLAGSP